MKYILALLLIAGCSDDVHRERDNSKPVYVKCDIQIFPTPIAVSAVHEVSLVGQGYYEIEATIQGNKIQHEIAQNILSVILPPSSSEVICVNVRTLKGSPPKVSFQSLEMWR